MHAEIGDKGKLFFWNVDAPVGLNGANLFEDVLFVQWCFYKLSKWDKIPPDVQAVFAKTPINGECTGHEGDLLIASIKALQQFNVSKGRGGKVDGRVSPATGGHYKYQGGSVAFLVFYLNAVLRVMHPQQYPRIDLMPEFVWKIKATAIEPFI